MKPVLLWPKPRSRIATDLDRSPDDFILIDTDYADGLQKFSKVRADTPIFDPYPTYGQRYQEFLSHVSAKGYRYHIVGLKKCQDILRTLKDPSLSRSTMDEILLALGYADSKTSGPGR